MRALQGLRSALALPLEKRVGEGNFCVQDEFDIPRPWLELVQEPDPVIMAELELSEPEPREPVHYHHPSLHELRTSRFAPDTFVGAVLEARKGEQTYQFQCTTDCYGPKITCTTSDTSYDSRIDLTELAFALRAKIGGVFHVPTAIGAVARQSTGQGKDNLSATLYLVDTSTAFVLHLNAMQEYSEDPARLKEWNEAYEAWNPCNARKDFRANGKPQQEGLTGRFTHPRMYMPEPIAFSQHNIGVVIDYLIGLGFDMQIKQLDYQLTRTERMKSSFAQDLLVR